jgi:hypothetical protein
MVAPAQVYASFWFDRDDQDRFFRRLGRTLTVSLALHVVALLVVMGLRLTPHGERPLAAVEVNLVNLPTPVKTVVRLPQHRFRCRLVPAWQRTF